MTEQRARCRKWELENPEHYKRIYTQANARKRADGSYWRWYLKRTYNITPEQWTAIFEKQGKRCAICDKSEPGLKRRWNLDHNHITGKIRGILCDHCNRQVLPTIENHAHLVGPSQEYLEKYQ